MTGLPPPATALGRARDDILAVPAVGQVVFRVLGGAEPDLRDFTSRAARGDDRRGDEPAILWVAVSTFDREDRAWKRVKAGLGEGVAAVEVHGEDGIHIARTRRRPGHYSVWGEAEVLLSRATPVARGHSRR